MIKEIYIAPKNHAEQTSVKQIEVVKGKGIIGDRNFGKAKSKGQNITFVEKEVIDDFCSKYRFEKQLNITRRNIITEGIRLNELVGKTFKIGEVEIYGEKLCEPCKTLGKRLGTENVPSKEIIRFFVGKGGLRGTILTSGTINTQMDIDELD